MLFMAKMVLTPWLKFEKNRFKKHLRARHVRNRRHVKRQNNSDYSVKRKQKNVQIVRRQKKRQQIKSVVMKRQQRNRKKHLVAVKELTLFVYITTIYFSINLITIKVFCSSKTFTVKYKVSKKKL